MPCARSMQILAPHPFVPIDAVSPPACVRAEGLLLGSSTLTTASNSSPTLCATAPCDIYPTGELWKHFGSATCAFQATQAKSSVHL